MQSRKRTDLQAGTQLMGRGTEKGQIEAKFRSKTHRTFAT